MESTKSDNLPAITRKITFDGIFINARHARYGTRLLNMNFRFKATVIFRSGKCV